MNPPVSTAKKAIENYVNSGQIITVENPDHHRAGCFVSIHKKSSGELRGCIGTILPACKNLSLEIINNAISACQDPRFEPITQKELDDLNISVDILSEPEPIESTKSLDPKKYGVIVKSKDGRTGLLLPDLDGIDDAMYQIAIAREKAGISVNEPIYLYRFTVERFKEL
ncbi:MAG: AmmeMemoRadiSam system protein A [Patescibacteria group bacterium]|jgi:hypothetical protein